MTRLGALRLILSLGIVVVLVAWGQPDTRTLAAWTDSVQVSGATLKTAALAPPTSVAVTQACVADPAPVRRSGAGGTSFATGGGSGSLVIPKPSGAVTGDLLVAGITWGGNYLSTFLGPPAGWTLVRKDADNALGQFVYTRFVVAGEPSSYTWTGLSENAAGGIAAYSGVDTSAPVNASSGQVDSVDEFRDRPFADHHPGQRHPGRRLRPPEQREPESARRHDRDLDRLHLRRLTRPDLEHGRRAVVADGRCDREPDRHRVGRAQCRPAHRSSASGQALCDDDLDTVDIRLRHRPAVHPELERRDPEGGNAVVRHHQPERRAPDQRHQLHRRRHHNLQQLDLRRPPRRRSPVAAADHPAPICGPAG